MDNFYYTKKNGDYILHCDREETFNCGKEIAFVYTGDPGYEFILRHGSRELVEKYYNEAFPRYKEVAQIDPGVAINLVYSDKIHVETLNKMINIHNYVAAWLREQKKPFPACSEKCDMVEYFGAGECENICTHRFDKDGEPLEEVEI